MPFAAALAVAAAVHFPVWERVTPETATRAVPEHTWTGVPGAVQPREFFTQRQRATCPLYDEQGRVIGFALGCLRNTGK